MYHGYRLKQICWLKTGRQWFEESIGFCNIWCSSNATIYMGGVRMSSWNNPEVVDAVLSGFKTTSVLDSLTNCKVLSTVSQIEDYEGWKAARRLGVGGSEVGAIMGVNSYATPRTVYLRKTGQYDEDFDDAAKERMEWGHLLEPIVAFKYTQQSGNRVVESPATLVHKDHPWAIANVDRFIVDEHGVPFGILECKCTDARNASDWLEGEPPVSYLYQLQWYMWITGMKFGALACLIGGNRFVYYELYINEDLLMQTIPAVDHFWNYHVKNLIEPPLTGIEADSELVSKMFPAEKALKGSEKVLENPEYAELADLHVELKAQAKALGKQIDEIANRLTEQLGTTEIGYAGDRVIKWSPQSQDRVDTDKLKTQYPEVYHNVTRQINFRKLSVK